MKKLALLPLALCVSTTAFAWSSADKRCQSTALATPEWSRTLQAEIESRNQSWRDSLQYERGYRRALAEGRVERDFWFEREIRTTQLALRLKKFQLEDCQMRASRPVRETWDASRCTTGFFPSSCDNGYVLDTRFEFARSFPSGQHAVYFQNGQIVTSSDLSLPAHVATQVVSSRAPVPSSSSGSYCKVTLPESDADSTLELGPSFQLTFDYDREESRWLGHLSCYRSSVSYEMKLLSDCRDSAAVQEAELQHNRAYEACDQAVAPIRQALSEKRGELERLQGQIVSDIEMRCAAFESTPHDDAVYCSQDVGIEFKRHRGYVIESRNNRLLSETIQAVLHSQAYLSQVAEQARIRAAIEAVQAEVTVLRERATLVESTQSQCRSAEYARHSDLRCLVQRSSDGEMLDYSGIKAALGDYVNISVDVALEQAQ